MRETRQIRSFVHQYPSGFDNPLHTHSWDQLLYASSGVANVRTKGGSWVLPTLRACWIPADVEHSFQTLSVLELRTLYLPPAQVAQLPEECVVFNVSPLLREIVLRVATLGNVDVDSEPNLTGLLFEELGRVQTLPLHVAWPKDPRAARVALRLARDPGMTRSLSRICREAGGSKRTIERAFLSDTGLPLGTWRRQMRLCTAVCLLANGVATTRVAEQVGYSSPSAFIEMFRRNLGETPARYKALRLNPEEEIRPSDMVPVPTYVVATGQFLGPSD